MSIYSHEAATGDIIDIYGVSNMPQPWNVSLFAASLSSLCCQWLGSYLRLSNFNPENWEVLWHETMWARRPKSYFLRLIFLISVTLWTFLRAVLRLKQGLDAVGSV